jgi:predicted site-specific integrase-resolvase
MNGKTYYFSAEACEMACTNRNTYLRWVRENKFTDVVHRDRNGWRLFTEDDVQRLKSKVNKIQRIDVA